MHMSCLGQYHPHFLNLISRLGSGTLYALDMAIKQAFTAANITFPSALGGMFGIVALLLATGEAAASKLLAFYMPTLNWIAKWLPLFYVASLVTLPLSLKGIAGKIPPIWQVFLQVSLTWLTSPPLCVGDIFYR